MLHLNLDVSFDNWAPYFFPYFYMGIILNRAVQNKGIAKEFWLYQALLAFALHQDWRWRLAMAALVAVTIYVVEKTGWRPRWIKNPLFASLGKISYSLFLVHFPVLVLVATAFVRMEIDSPVAAVLGLIVAFFLSIGTAAAFHRWVGTPSIRIAQTLAAPAAA